jgi:hypothetical protein
MAIGNPTIIELHVEGLPPAKSQRSIFSSRSTHHRRLLALLEEAHRVMAERGFRGFGAAPVSLEVEVMTPPGMQPGDGTNYLGGIADALEVKTVRIKAAGPLDHLGYRQHVGLYDNDRQIKQIIYRELVAERVSYTVRVRALNPT